ncbi:MAG: LytTR family DNA-binding domain-containing protein [Bacteroidota bacterium]
MLRCLIIDDEPLAVNLLEDYVNKIAGIELVQSFNNPLEALPLLESEEINLIFLDVQMPELTGIQLGNIINGKIPIILTTAYDEYAIQGYELDVIDYLLKPISFDRFFKAVQKAQKRITPNMGKANNSLEEEKHPGYIFVKTNYKTQRINLEDILYLESLGDYVKIHLPDQRIMTLENMKHFASTLPQEQFMRIHRSFIISFSKIDFIERNRVIIGETYIPISHSYQKEFWRRTGRG